ncbi:MAG TPA: BON domain-containing protein [Nevskiales bacterium]|nr:BON domain-containing protein [Nevskiales bacterium]
METTYDSILKQVQAAFEHETPLNLQTHPIQIQVSDGTLILEGEVPDIATKQKAVVLATRTVGATLELVDRLRVATEPVGDGALRDAVCERLLQDIDFRNCTIRARLKGQLETLHEAIGDTSGAIEVAVEDGVVTLAGQVISLSHKRLAGVLAWWARGCRNVVNALEVVPPEEDSDDEITDALRLVLETDPFVHADQIGIGTKNRVVTLEGVVATEAERNRAEQDAWCLHGVADVINHIVVQT